MGNTEFMDSKLYINHLQKAIQESKNLKKILDCKKYNYIIKAIQESKNLKELIDSIFSAIHNHESICDMMDISRKIQEIKLTKSEKDYLTSHLQQPLHYLCEINQRGSKIEKYAIQSGIYYGAFIHGIGPDELIEWAQTIDNIYKEASIKNNSQTIEATHKYFEDLLKSPRPLPEIARGYSDFSITLSQMFSDMSVEEREKRGLQILKQYVPILESHAKMMLKNSERWITKVLKGYEDLVEGDFRAFLAWLVTLTDIIDRNPSNYEKWKRKKIEKKAKKLKKRYPKLVDCYNEHIRNAIAHVNYEIDPKGLIITFRDINWVKQLSFMDLKCLYSKMASLIELSLFISDPKDYDLLEQLSRHRDPDFWENILQR